MGLHGAGGAGPNTRSLCSVSASLPRLQLRKRRDVSFKSDSRLYGVCIIQGEKGYRLGTGLAFFTIMLCPKLIQFKASSQDSYLAS